MESGNGLVMLLSNIHRGLTENICYIVIISDILKICCIEMSSQIEKSETVMIETSQFLKI